ncbi:MAG: zinc-ribbon domain-containing protein [Lachnospiraceae bacterium]|nr:zinc-ribbon domain-containing protein [Lachnospiraceae bacterium]
MNCPECGAPCSENARFCPKCGKPVHGKAPENKGFFARLTDAVKDLVTHPKKLIPTFVLVGIWLLFSLLSAFGVNLPFLRTLYTVTYANGGMYGGIVGAVGGIFGKAVFAGVVNGIVLTLCEKKNPFSTLGKELPEVIRKASANGMTAASPFLIGSGVGMFLYWFFNITSAPVNCGVAVAGAVGSLLALGGSGKKGLLFSLLTDLPAKFSKGKLPDKVTVNRVLTGFSAGFLVGLPITLARFRWLPPVVGAVLLAAGITLGSVGKKGMKRAAAATAAFLLAFGSLFPFFAVPVSSEDSLPKGYVDPYEVFGEQSGNTNDYIGKAASLYLVPESTASGLYEVSLSSYVTPAEKIPALTAEGEGFTIDRTGAHKTLTFTGKMEFSMPGYKGSLMDYSDHLFTGTDSFSVGITDPMINGVLIYYSCAGTETASYSDTFNGKTDGDSLSCKIAGNGLTAYYEVDGSTFYCCFKMPGDVSGLAPLILKFRIAGVIPAEGSYVSSDEETGDDPDYVPYRGRLTYTSGRTNKRGQPFPDLMDFDMDGEITWADVIIQSELSHNPDYLDLPLSPAAIAAIALATALLGGAGGIVGSAAGSVLSEAASAAVSAGEAAAETAVETAAEAAAANASSLPDLGNGITRDEDGDLNVIDPVTGEHRLYKANGDGTYTNPMTGATYTESELAAAQESRTENAGLLREDAQTAAEAVSAQREDNRKASFYDEEAKREKAEAAKEEAREAYLTGLGKKYGVDPTDEGALRKEIGAEQAKAEIESYEHLAEADEIKDKQEYLETVEKTADVSVDVLAEVTGRKDIKAAYTATKSTLVGASEAHAEGRSVLAGAAKGAVEGAVDIAVDNVDGAAAKMAANMAGETYKSALDATVKGENVAEAALKGFGEGALKGSVDVGFDAAGDLAKGVLGDSADDVVKSVLGTEVTKETLTDATKALASDMTKEAVDSAFKMPGED